MLSIVIPAEAGIQKSKITGFRIKCGMTGKRNLVARPWGIAN
jgi:hypothetical protein